MTQEFIEKAVKAALEGLGAGDAAFVVSRPSNMKHGDFATNAALSAAKLLKRNPKELAHELKAELEKQIVWPEGRMTAAEGDPRTFAEQVLPKAIQIIEVAGAGFINFFLSSEAVSKVVVSAATESSFGNNSLYAGKKIMVEYTDPNPFKEFHIGHLMSNTIGESIARLLEHSGAEVVRANYQGDVGPHVAKALYILLERNISEPSIQDISAAYVEGAKRYEENADDKTAIDQLNKKIYEKTDPRVNELYAKGRTLSLEHFEELYKILDTKFDFYFFESETAPIGLEAVKAHPDVFVESEGALVFKGESYGLHTRVFVNKLGLPTYEAKELGLMELKTKKVDFDESITITANEQSEYFKVVFLAAKIISPEVGNKLVHRSHGMMRFASGKMSSRLGNVVTGESLLMDLKEVAKEKMLGRNVADVEKISEEVAVGALKYVVLKQGTGKDIIFDQEKSLSTEGDSGPYLQYAHTRAASLIKAAKEAGISAAEADSSAAGNDADRADFPAVSHQGNAFKSARSALARTILHFPGALARSASELEPHHLTTYLTELASTFNSWYASERLIGGENPEYGLLLAEACEKILARGLDTLGIKSPEEM